MTNMQTLDSVWSYSDIFQPYSQLQIDALNFIAALKSPQFYRKIESKLTTLNFALMVKLPHVSNSGVTGSGVSLARL